MTQPLGCNGVSRSVRCVMMSAKTRERFEISEFSSLEHYRGTLIMPLAARWSCLTVTDEAGIHLARSRQGWAMRCYKI